MTASAIAVLHAPTSPPAATLDFLRPPYDRFTPAEILAHMRNRTSVSYFPILDEAETAPDILEAILDGRFTFNGESHRLAAPVPWLVNPSADVEWHILLHKFYYVAGLAKRFHDTGDTRYSEKCLALIDSWIAVTPPGFIATDVTGRRVQNWIYAHFFLTSSSRPAEIPPELYARFLASISTQVEHLCAHLAPARNHRTLELYAIFLAAVVFPEMRGAAGWLAFSLEELARNVASDLLPDGVQVELSTDYHHIVLRNFLCVRRLARLNGIAVPPEMDRAILKALEFSLHAHRPDGIVPSFSDGDARDFRELLAWGHEIYGREDFAYAATFGERGVPPAQCSADFPDSGYHVLRSGWGGSNGRYRDARYLMLDCGPLGAGNHGHFDLLSFEAYAYGRPLVVDPGRFTYSEAGDINWRARFRGTEAHNTVLVDGCNQTRYTPGKRKLKVSGPAPRHTLRAAIHGAQLDLLHGVAESHEYPVVHERLIAFVRGEYWIISDVLHGTGDHRYDLLFHLDHHAQGRTSVEQRGSTSLVSAPQMLLAQCAAGSEVMIDDGFVSQRYGQKHAAPVIRTRRHGASTAFQSVLLPFKHEAPQLALRALSVSTGHDEPIGYRTQALAVDITRDGESLTDVWFFTTGPVGTEWTFEGVRYNGAHLLMRDMHDGRRITLHASPGANLCDLDGTALAAGGAV